MKKILFLLLILVPLISCGQATHKSGVTVQDSLIAEGIAKFKAGMQIGDSIAGSDIWTVDSLIFSATDTAIYIKTNRIPLGLSAGGAGGGASTFLELTDTPGAYTPLYLIRANAGGTALVFIDPATYAITNFLLVTTLGDYTISDTKANFNTALSDGSFAFDGGAFHDGFSDFLASEHVIWSITGVEDIHDDRIAESSVTQHEAAIDHIALTNTHDTSLIDYTKWYFSNDGNNANHGHSEAYPKQTIAHLNTLTLAAGHFIYFKKGDTFSDAGIVVGQSGSDGSPITFGAYSEGEDPIISGFTTLTGWADEGGGIYSKAITVASDSQTNVVLVDGVNTGMGRYPDATYLTYEAYVDGVSITDNGLGDAPDWEDAEAVIRKNDWGEERCFITDHTGDVITYNDPPGSASWEPTNDYGYFIQNDLRTVTATNEWFHDTVGGVSDLYIFGNPAAKTVKVATLVFLIYIDNKNYITIENLSFEGSTASGIYNYLGDDIIIQNCDISYTGVDGILNYYGHDNLIDDNTISNTARAGIRNQGGNNITITNNTISKASMIRGAAMEGYLGNGILHGGDPAGGLIQYNNIDSSGYHGIGFFGNNAEVRNNFVNYSVLIVEDGGGIYTSSTYSGRIIDGNIVLNTIGDLDGTSGSISNASGIYLDAVDGDDVTVTNNTAAHSTAYGIQINQTTDHTITGNTIYNNWKALLITNLTGAPDIASYTIEDNIFFAKDSFQHAFMAYANTADYPDYAALDNNYYLRPIDDTDVIYTWDIITNDLDSITLAEWQALTGQDASSQGSPASVSDTADIDFYYNASQVSREFILDYPAIDVEGTEYTRSITLLPYTSAVLISDPDYLIEHRDGLQVGDSNYTFDQMYISGDNDEYLNIVIDGDKVWQIIRPFGQEPPVFPFVADYYISPTGDDVAGDGSFENPWFTLDKVWTVLAAGDTVYCRGGTYEWLDQQLLAGVNGTSADTIKIFAYPGETPIFTASGSYTPPAAHNSAKPLILATADYTWWKGITIANYEQASAQTDGYNGMYMKSGSDNNIFEQLTIYNCGSGFYIRGNSDQNLVLNCDFYGNMDPYSGTPYGNADGLAIAWNTDVSDTNRVQGCRFWWNSDDGLDLFNNDGFVYIDSCWSWYNGYIRDTYAAGADGNGFKLGDQAAGAATDTSRYLTNCISFNNKQSGFAENDMDERSELYNNLSYMDGVIHGTFGAGFEFTGTIPNPIKNNIAYLGRVDEDINDVTNVDHNDWDLGGVTISDADFVNINDTLSLDNARQSGGWLPDIDFGKLVGGSDAVDAGTDVGLPFLGADPDLGAFEKQ